MLRCAIFGIEHMHISSLYGSLSRLPEEVSFIGWADSSCPDDQDHEKKARMSLAGGFDKLKYYPDWLGLAAERPDLALVCTDNAAHAETACKLMSMGISVVLEKPMASTYADAKRIYDTARQIDVRLAVNWPIAWFPSFNKAKELCDEGRIGQIMRVTYRSPATWGPFSYSKDGVLPPVDELEKTWWYRHERGGGSILDYACYGTALSTWFFGRRAKAAWGVMNSFSPEAKETGVEDFSAMLYDFGGGIGLLEGSWSTYNSGEVPSGPIIHGTEGTIVCDRHSNLVKLYTGKSHSHTAPAEVFECPASLPGLNFGRNIVDHLISGAPLHPLLEPSLNLSVMAALEAGRSSASGGGVKVEGN